MAILTPPAGYLQPFGRFGGTHTFYLAFSGTSWLPSFFLGHSGKDVAFDQQDVQSNQDIIKQERQHK